MYSSPLALLAVLGVAQGFAPSTYVAPARSTQLFAGKAAKVDSADLVKEAIQISKKFGATSPEARLAWEAVEEVDASDNR